MAPKTGHYHRRKRPILLVETTNFIGEQMRLVTLFCTILLALACDDGGPGSPFADTWEGNVPQGAMWIFLDAGGDGFGVINATTGSMAIDVQGTATGNQLSATVRRSVTDAFVADLAGTLRNDTIFGTWNSPPAHVNVAVRLTRRP